jgi:predicted nucleic acid-binding protein
VLTLAAEKGLLSLADAISGLRRTTFRVPEKLIEELLRRDAQRGAEETDRE